MIEITVEEVLQATGGKLLSGRPETRISRFSVDSRDASEGTLFTAVTGGNTDGHAYLGKALENGASAALVSLLDAKGVTREGQVLPKWQDRAIILVPDTVEALQKAGALKRSHAGIPAVGVTGSVGKTTSREMISYALSAGRKVFTTSKTE